MCPNFTIIPQGIAEESDDAPKKFKNIDSEEFVFHWDGVPFGGVFPDRISCQQEDIVDTNGNPSKKRVCQVLKPILPGETVIMPKYLVNFASMHLSRKMWKRQAMNAFVGTDYEKKNAAIKIVNPEEEVKLMKQMVAENFPEEPKPVESVAPTSETVIDKSQVETPAKPIFKCEDCEFTAKSKAGLAAHRRKKHAS